MEQIVLVTGADRGLGQAVTAGLLQLGWRVLAGQYMPEWPELGALLAQYPDTLHILPLDVSDTASVRAAAQQAAGLVDHIDMLISNAGIRGEQGDIRTGLDYAQARKAFDVNALGGIRVAEAFLPLTDKGAMKRLCFVSSEAGCIALCQRQDNTGYCMSKAALNMAVRIMHNHLFPEGYTFRLYHPGWVRGYMGGTKSTRALLEPEIAAAYAIPFFIEDREDEGRLELTDYLGHEWPF
jgi:NAD(P)-dependent dehydrogenase (short-subunit alcohol dehydrogenase family)